MRFNAEKLIDLRWSNRLKQKELAELIGVSPTMVCNWEKGKHVPSAWLLLKLAEALGVEPASFFDEIIS